MCYNFYMSDDLPDLPPSNQVPDTTADLLKDPQLFFDMGRRFEVSDLPPGFARHVADEKSRRAYEEVFVHNINRWGGYYARNPTTRNILVHGLGGEGDSVLETIEEKGMSEFLLNALLNDFVLEMAENKNPEQDALNRKVYAGHVIEFLIGANTGGISIVKCEGGDDVIVRAIDDSYAECLYIMYSWLEGYRDAVEEVKKGDGFAGFKVSLGIFEYELNFSQSQKQKSIAEFKRGK